VTNFSNNAACREGLFREPNSWGIRAGVIRIRWPTYTTTTTSITTLFVREMLFRDPITSNTSSDQSLLREPNFKSFGRQVQQRYASYGRRWNACRWVPIWHHRNNDAKDDYGIRRKPIHYPYVDRFLDDDVSHIRHVCNHIHKSPNRHSAYEENINYGEMDVDVVNLELPLEKNLCSHNYSFQ
jgi:hypothetical protein